MRSPTDARRANVAGRAGTAIVPDTLAVFVSADSAQPFRTVVFAEGVLGLGHLLRILSPLLR